MPDINMQYYKEVMNYFRYVISFTKCIMYDMQYKPDLTFNFSKLSWG